MDSWAGLDDLLAVCCSMKLNCPYLYQILQSLEHVRMQRFAMWHCQGAGRGWLSPGCPSGLCPLCVSGEAVSLAVLHSYSEVPAQLKGKEPSGLSPAPGGTRNQDIIPSPGIHSFSPLKLLRKSYPRQVVEEHSFGSYLEIFAVSALREQATGQEEMAANCTRGGLHWILGRSSSWKGLYSPGTAA